MGDLNKLFFDEYTRLDKLCREIYSDLPKENLKGVTNYIDDMKNTPYHISARVPGWEDYLRELIHIRHLRNHLAHEPGAFNEELCTNDDIQWVRYLHHGIMNGTDPLTTARKAAQRATYADKKAPTQKNKPMLTKKQKGKIRRFLRSIFRFLLHRF